MTLTSIKIEKIKEKLKKGSDISNEENIFYRKNISLRNKNLDFNYTKDEINEIIKCQNDIEYFIKKYFNFLNYYKKVIKHYKNNKYQIYARSYEIGFDNIIALIYLWELTFNKNRIIYFIDDDIKKAFKLLENIKNYYSQLPFFLKRGIRSYKQKSIMFDNGSNIYISTPFYNVVGFSINILHINNLGIMKDEEVDKIFSFYLPTVSAVKQNNNI